MHRQTLRSLAVFVVLSVVVAIPALSAPLAGGFYDGGSWYWGTGNDPGGHKWDFMRVDLIQGNRYFENPVFRSISATGWSNGWSVTDGAGNVTTATLWGPERTSTVNFNMYFTGLKDGANLDFWWTVYDRDAAGGCVWRETTLIHILNGGASWEVKSMSEWNPGCVPEPASIVYFALLGLGIAGAGAWRKRQRPRS